jgi:fumarate reductase iron-sulfur subunit
MSTAPTPRELRIHVLRHDPRDPASRPHVDSFAIEEADGMTLFLALEEIRDRYDASLRYDFVCRAGICGSCGMLVNGRPGLGCRTLTRDLPADIMLAPLPFFELIADLSVDTGKWMRALTERLQAWVQPGSAEADLDRLEDRMEPDLAEAIYELDRCIECGCCVAACGTARMREDFVGAVGLGKVARFRLDPRDARDDAAWYALVGDDDGVFGCMTLLGCQDVCPKELPLRAQIAYLRRAMVRQALAPPAGPEAQGGGT